MGMGNISLKNFDTITKIKNVAEHLAHAKYPTTFSTIALSNLNFCLNNHPILS